jgi:hypothetical protein
MNMCRVKINNIVRAQNCVHWLIQNVGPAEPHPGGNHVRGEGWSFWICDKELTTVMFELTPDVDPETATLFVLTWA